jgi:hypothetical protein
MPGNTDQVVRRAALAAATAVIVATPVDTGRARANWQVGLDAPVLTLRETAGPSPAAPIAAAQAQIERYRGSAHREIWLTNNLPYIQKLNEGWSAQAPAGYVEQAIAMAVRSVKGARLLKRF